MSNRSAASRPLKQSSLAPLSGSYAATDRFKSCCPLSSFRYRYQEPAAAGGLPVMTLWWPITAQICNRLPNQLISEYPNRAMAIKAAVDAHTSIPMTDISCPYRFHRTSGWSVGRDHGWNLP